MIVITIQILDKPSQFNIPCVLLTILFEAIFNFVFTLRLLAGISVNPRSVMRLLMPRRVRTPTDTMVQNPYGDRTGLWRVDRVNDHKRCNIKHKYKRLCILWWIILTIKRCKIQRHENDWKCRLQSSGHFLAVLMCQCVQIQPLYISLLKNWVQWL